MTHSSLLKTLLCASLLLPLVSAAAPIGYWRMAHLDQENNVPNLVGEYANLSLQGSAELTAGIDGQALTLGGNNAYLIARDADKLVMSDQLTLDAWVKVEPSATGTMQALIDKRGERYRLQFSSQGNPSFGLKSRDSRADLTVDQSVDGRWVRITGVFERPVMRLYVDAELVGESRWDHDVDAGGPLLVGSKAGVTDFFRGSIDTIAIYNYARAPQPEDYAELQERFPPRQAQARVPRDAQFSVSRSAEAVTLRSEEWTIGFNAATLDTVSVRDKVYLQDNHAPLLSAAVLQPTTDGYKPVEVVSDLRLQAVEENSDAVIVRYSGSLRSVGSDLLNQPVTVEFLIPSDFPRIEIGLDFPALDPASSVLIERFALNLPLELQPRKRVAQGGERGINWDTRYFYQFFINTTGYLMAPPTRWNAPEVNIWRFFHVDQLTPNSFTLWRQEAEDTSAHFMQYGRQAAGWMALYDEQGGFFYGVQDFAQHAPIGLHADAQLGGSAHVYLHPPAAEPETIQSLLQRFQQAPLKVDLVFFPGELPQVWQLGLLQQLGYDEKNGAEDLTVLAEELVQLRNLAGPDETAKAAPHITGGLPFARGELSPEQAVAVFTASGNALPTQQEVLGYWPDGSVKWLSVTFPADTDADLQLQTDGALELPFQVSFRNQDQQRFSLKTVPAQAKQAPIAQLSAEEDLLSIDAGPLQARLGKGERWLQALTLNGRSIIDPEAKAQLAVDFLRPDSTLRSNEHHVQGQEIPGNLVVEHLAIEQNGPLRASVLLRGTTDAEVPVRVHLRMEFFQGVPTLRVLSTIEFLDHDTRQDFVREIALRLPLQLDGVATVTTGEQTILAETLPVLLQQESPHSYRISTGSTPWDRTYLEEGERSEGWLQVAGPALSVTAIGRDIWAEFPKALTWDPRNQTLSIGMWPRGVAPMDVRRYSNYPHSSQGESTMGPNTWVEDRYYPNDPFAGVSRTQEFLLSFADASAPADAPDVLAADFQSRPLVYAGAERYRDTEVVLDYPDLSRFPLYQANNDAFVDFILFHKDYWNWYGFWHNGDFQHHFRSGYGWILPPDVLKEYLAMSPEERGAAGRPRERTSDYRPQHDWASDNGRWGWTNTEGLPNLWLQNEYLRTGRRDLFFASEALARHSRDVVTRHNGQWFGRGTRHGVQHWSDGNHEVRQTTQAEGRIHYFLTGEPRTREVALRLNDEVYTQEDISVHAAHSGHLYGILFAWELTGDPAIGEIMRNYLHAMSYPEGFAISQAIRFPGPVRNGPPAGLNEANMFFHTFGGMHAALEYYALTGDVVVRDALVKMAQAIAQGNPRALWATAKVIGFGIQHADNSEQIRAFATGWLSSPGAGSETLANIVAKNPAHWSGPTSYLNRNIPGSFFAVNSIPYLLQSLGEEPQLDAELLDSIELQSQQGVSRSLQPLSWQSQFDDPAFDEYLTPWQPWRNQ